MAKVGSWSTTAGNNNSTPPDGWPEGQAPSTVNDCARELMAQIRAVWNDAQFFDQGFVPTFVSTTSFTVPGDQTSAIHAGRRLKLFDATAGVATTIYATVVTASFTALTTINVTNDAGQLTSSLSSFAISILSHNNDAIPRDMTLSTGAAICASITDPVSCSQVEIYALQLACGNNPPKGATFYFNFMAQEAGSATSLAVTTTKIRVQPISGVSFPVATLSLGGRIANLQINYTGILNVLSVGTTGLVRASIVAFSDPGFASTFMNAINMTVGAATTVDTTNFQAVGMTNFQTSGGNSIVTSFLSGYIERKGPLK